MAGGDTGRASEGVAEPKPFTKRQQETACARDKKTKQVQREMIATAFSTGFGALYALIAEFEGDFWRLDETEGDELSDSLIDALDTLEGTEEYERIIASLSKIAPWGVLAAVAWRVTGPRIKASRAKRATAKAARSGERGGAVHRPDSQGDENPNFPEEILVNGPVVDYGSVGLGDSPMGE